MNAEVDQVLAYWFGRTAAERATKQQQWFSGSPEIDDEIRGQFGELVERARAGELAHWGDTPRGALAWLILVDQFSRNLHRGRAEAFRCDPQALAWARAHLAHGRFDDLSPSEQLFALLPLEHAEDLDAQKECVARLIRLALRDQAAFAELREAIEWARKHLDVIARFGRFPHRNAVLGRPSTPEEVDYLAFSKQANQWL